MNLKHNLSTGLWFNGNAKEAVDYYLSIFSNAKITQTHHYTKHGPGPEGGLVAISFELNNQVFVAINAGPEFTFNPSVSFMIFCDTQEELDYYWSKLTEGGKEMHCGWLTDKYGITWQLVPATLLDMMNDPDREKAANVAEVMYQMVKLDIAALKAAHEK